MLLLRVYSKDMSYLDDLLPQTFFDFTVLVAVVLATIIIVCMVNPWVLLSTVPLMIGFFFIRQFYLKSAREVSRGLVPRCGCGVSQRSFM